MFNAEIEFDITEIVPAENCDGKRHGCKYIRGMPLFSTHCQNGDGIESKALFLLQMILRTVGGKSNEANDSNKNI